MFKRKSTAVVVVALCGQGLAASAMADGFIDDSHLNLTMRNFFIKNDVKNTTKATGGVQEWAQGFILNYTSGYTPGTVGFGVDAIAQTGILLDAGGSGARNRTPTPKPNQSRVPGVLSPLDSDGNPESTYSALGLTAKARISKTVLQIGTLQPKLPVLIANDGRLLPQWYEGAQITSNDITNLTLTGGKIERVKDRSSTDIQGLAIGGNAKNARSNAFYFAGADYKITPNWLVSYEHGELEDFYKQDYFGTNFKFALPVGMVTVDLKDYVSDSDGKNGSAAGRNEGYTGTGYYGTETIAQGKGKIDNNLFTGMVTYGIGPHAFTVGYQKSSGDSATPFLSQGGGASAPSFTDRLTSSFLRSGEQTYIYQYAYDFTSLGVPGLTANVSYFDGAGIRSALGDGNEWERDFFITYVKPTGPLKGFGVKWLNSTYRSQSARVGTPDADQNRVMISYTLPIF